MSTIFAITNQKGGVGKTTTALNLASALADENKHVLLIDNDPQGNLTASMGYTPAEQKYTLANLLLAAIDYPEDLSLHLPRCILHTDGKPDLIPANRRLSDAAARLQVMQISQYSAANDAGRCAEKMLAQVMEPLCDAYDYIIIDCGLKQELLTVNALTASDYCIIPVQSHFLASEGIPDVLDMVRSVQKHFNPDLKIAGILLTMYQSRPSNPNSLGRPSRIRLCSRAVAGSKVRSSARPRQTPCSSCTTSFSHSSRMVNALLPFLPQLMQPPGTSCKKQWKPHGRLWYTVGRAFHEKQRKF